MKSLLASALVSLFALGFGAGCGHVDLSPEGARNRTLKGTINTGVALPAGAEILVRIVSSTVTPGVHPATTDIPVVRQNAAAAEKILGEQVRTLAAPASDPVPFTIEYEADDALLRRGVNLEARIYFSGRVRYRTVSAHVVTLSSSAYPQSLMLQAVDR